MVDRQTHVHSAHLFSCSWPMIDCRAAEKEQETAALQQMVLLTELRWNSLCYKCSLVFFWDSNRFSFPCWASFQCTEAKSVQCRGMRAHTHTLGYLMNGLTCLLALSYWTNRVPVRANKLSLELFCNQILELWFWSYDNLSYSGNIIFPLKIR